MRFLLFILLLTSSPLAAERYQLETLFDYKAWNVTLTHDSVDDDFWCSAQTDNRIGQTFTIAVYPNNSLSVLVFDSRWDLNPRPIDFIIDIDYSRWEISGKGDGIGISVSLEPGKKVGEFISQIAAGSAVALYNNDERRLATFSLAGSKAAILKLTECWRAVKVDQSDPFKSSSDPF